ncbi:MAG TPA: L,D-transpeptidase family protein [Xanthobacteraceae bacterium]
MSGYRVDRFFASTAIALLLAVSASGTFAASEPASGSDAAALLAQDSQADKAAQPAAAGSAQNAPTTDAKPPAAPSSAATPAAPTPSVAGEAKPDATPGAATAAPGEPAPAKSAAEAQPAEKPADNAADKPTDKPATTATAPATASPEGAAPATAVAANPDAAITEQLRELANGKFDRVLGSKKDRTQIDAFYSGRNYAPLWISDGKVNARATAAIDYLHHVDADGLDPADYPVPSFAALSAPADLADAEIKLTAAVVTYAHHASVGRVHWSRVSADIEFSTSAAEPGDVLAAVAGVSDVAATLDSYEPQTPGYRALKVKLADIRAGKIDKEKAPIGKGAVLKIGMEDARVPALRERLHVSGDSGTAYDKPLAEAVKKFQQQHDLAATGTLTAATVEALNGRQPDRVTDIIIANMERWRWMPHRLPNTYVIVNLPDFTLRVMHGGKQMWVTRIVIGKPEMPTPIMTAEMKFITVNPTWNVPPSIVNHEYLPALAQDPTVLERMGLRVDRNADGSIHIYQPPGEKNALGRIRVNFPNKFLVYQHDTPDKNLFAYDKRAFSHGCMRVQDPVHYAEVLLSLVRPGDRYTEDRIRKMFGTSETDIQFPTFIPVNLTYQTAFVDDAGKLEIRDDIYGRDRALLAVLKGTDRKVADIPVEHKIDISHREVLAIPDEPSWFGGRTAYGGGRGYYPNGGAYYGGGNFFSRLFGGFGSAQPVPPAPLRQRGTARTKKLTHSGQTVER